MHDRPSSSSRTLGICLSFAYSKRYNRTIHHHYWKPTLPTLPTLPRKGEVQGEVNGKFNGLKQPEADAPNAPYSPARGMFKGKLMGSSTAEGPHHKLPATQERRVYPMGFRVLGFRVSGFWF